MKPPSGKNAGFTLVEVLVAAAVLGIMLVVLLSSVTTSLSIWRNTEDRIAADREGRSAYQMIAQDLASAVVPANTNLWPRITNTAQTSSLRFLTLKPADYQDTTKDFGDVCYVEYVVDRRAGSNFVTRKFVGSADTAQQLANPAGAFAALSANAAPSQLLATNIVPNNIALKGTPVLRTPADSNAIVPNFSALVAFLDTNSSLVYSNVTNFPTGTRPEAIQVSIGAADMDTLRNPQLLNNMNIPLRGGGFYTFTVNLPRQ
jgi:prepilin-type N-terminal cleavage/methylation domain-containing protein